MQIFTGVRYYNRFAVLAFIALSFSSIAMAEWKLDLSRRNDQVRESELSKKRKTKPLDEGGFFDQMLGNEATLETVILNTERGFIPNSINMRVGGRYLLHIVNVNEKQKNVSFVLDAFSEHHGTYYGKITTLTLEPKKEGVYSFQCPETAFEGKLVIIPGPSSLRQPASR